jgi:hypothetical protein
MTHLPDFPVQRPKITVRCMHAQMTHKICNCKLLKPSHFQQSFPWPFRSPQIVLRGAFRKAIAGRIRGGLRRLIPNLRQALPMVLWGTCRSQEFERMVPRKAMRQTRPSNPNRPANKTRWKNEMESCNMESTRG